MADNKVNFLRGTSAEYEAKTKDNDTFYYTTDTKKLYLGENEVGNGIDPKVIQAHIDNQTIHAKVWRGTQEEYNAIEPKEDDTVYIIKDSDNTLADKLIDDTSTTATDKTWSAKKINENDEVARTAINTHSGNDEIHVTAEEKAVWNGKAELADIPTTLPANGGNADTVDGKHASDFALKTDIPTTLPANGGNAETVGGFNNRTIFRPYYLASNANDCYTNGSYMCTPDTTNIPSANYGILVSFNGEGDKINNTWVCQNFYPTSSNYVYHRFWTNNTWTNWERMASVNDIPTSLPANGGNAATVNGLTVQTAVPANAKFTDTTYGNASASAPGLVSTGAQTLAGNKTFNGQVIPAGASAVGTAQARKIYAGTSDMTAGTIKLETGAIYLVYE